MIYLIMAALFVATLGGAYVRGHFKGEEAGRESQQPIIERLQQDKATALASNDRLKADLDLIQVKVNSCNSAVASLESASAEAARQAEAQKRAWSARVSSLEQDIAKRQKAAPVAPAQRCESARATLEDLAERLRDGAADAAPIPATAAPKPSTAVVKPATAVPPPAKGAALPPAIRRPK